MESSEQTKESSLAIALKHPLASFLAAFRFLTILPISWKSDEDGKYFRGSLFYFPVIGGLIGLVTSLVYLLVQPFMPQAVVAAGCVLLLGLYSGFLHCDGLADSGDGFFSSRPRERILEIMRDSRIGAMGVISLVGVMLLKFSALLSLDGSHMAMALLLIPVAGRSSILLSMALLPYARKESGLGALFYSSNSMYAALWGGLFLGGGALFFGIKPILFAGLTTFFITLVFSLWCKRKIGGATGDTLGAVCEITEMSVAITFSCLYHL